MKKFVMIILITMMCCSAVGCAASAKNDENVTEQMTYEETANKESIASENTDIESTSSEAAETADAYIGVYYCEETAMYLTVTASENEGCDYTFTWGDGADWELYYDAIAGEEALTITIPMKSDVVLTVTTGENGLILTGDDAYHAEVVQNRRLDGIFEKMN